MASMKSEIEDKILTCPLCLNILTDPKCLPCIHTFCRACLEMHIQHTANRGMFQCPECRETVWAQPGGVDAYRTNFFINRLKDLKFNTAPSDESPKCRSHPAKSVTLFCEQCDVCVCADCIVQKHKGHPCLSFSDARQDREKTLKNRLNDLEHATLGGKDSLRTQAKKVEALRQRQADVSDNMKAATQRLIEGIQEASKKTIRSLGDATRPVLEQHITYLDDLRTYTNQMESDMANMNLLVKKSSDVEMLDAYKDTANKASNFCETNFANKEDTLHKSTSQMKATYNELFGKFASQCKELIQQTKKELHEDVSLLKSADHKIAKHRRSFRGKGKISTSDLSKTPPKLGKKVREFGRPPQETRTITGLCVHAKTGHVYCCVGDKAFKLGGFLRKWRDIHSRLNIGSEAVNDVGESDDTLVFSVRSENGSPCKLAKYNTNSSSTETIELGFISEIPGIFICKDRSILVTDFSRGAFHKVSWTGETLRMFGTRALSQPWYIAETTGGQIVVSDNVGKSDVCLFSGEGSWRKSLKDETIAKGADNYLCDPYSVRTDSNGRIYVACCWTNCVLVFSGTGEYLSAVVSPEDGITHPISLHLTDDKIYIGHKDGVTSYSLIM